MESFFWHDYETFGGDARRDRPCQFAGIRTDFDLNIIDDPVELYCKPAPDFLPDPISCLITGISPQLALQRGVSEAEFCARIARELGEPGTCAVGYNSIRFDDEITRHMLYRCFYDPYEREWKNGNSRWDLIDVVRMTHALRPEGINWPQHEDGTPSFRLEELTKANGIEHQGAHDALVDVRATIAMAKLVKEKQPRLFDYLFQLRNKNRVLPLLDLVKREPVLHASRMFAAERGCLAIVLPLCRHPENSNGFLVADLLTDPSVWLNLGTEELRRGLFTANADLAEGESRVPIKTVHINKCPALAPLSVLNDTIITRYKLDLSRIAHHRELMLGNTTLVERLVAAFTSQSPSANADPDLMLYGGTFLGDSDKRACQRIRESRPEQLAAISKDLRDPRLPELLFRYRARNYPDSLGTDEKDKWKQHCQRRLSGDLPGAGVSQADFERLLTEALERGMPATLADQLRQYADSLVSG